ncbi:MAG: hypothetical protein Q8P76_01160 [bacterium]|nr:hypothetical protein [bacterium]
MTLKKRRLLFYFLILIFFVSGGAIIFYSTGWRLDLETRQISRLGGLFIRVLTPDAAVKIGKKTVPYDAGLLNTGSFVDLFPKNYVVEVAKDGYQPWKKEIEVESSLVTKLPPIVLIPQNPEKELVLKNVKDFWLGPKYLAWKNYLGKLFINDTPALGAAVLEWSANNNFALTANNGTYFLINLRENNAALNINLAWANLRSDAISKIKFDPENNSHLLIGSKNGLYSLDFNRLTIEKSLDKIASVFSQLYSKTSPDKQKIAALDSAEGQLTINFLKDSEDFNRKAGDAIILNTGVTEGILDFEWDKTSSYLFVQYPSGLYFVEIDNQAPNLRLISVAPDKFQYDINSNKLYLLSGGNLYTLKLN